MVLTIGAMFVGIFIPSIHYYQIVSDVYSWLRPWFSRTFVLVYIGFVVTIVIYWLQRLHALRRQIDATVSLLKAVQAITPYGEEHFGGEGYDAKAAENRSKLDYDKIMEKGYFQNFTVPSEPIASLIQNAGNGWPLNDSTVIAANVALWKLTTFNQLVQQQTDFNVAHVAEFRDADLDADQRKLLAESARGISRMIHEHAIGDSRWYPKLIAELTRNIEELVARKKRWLRIGRVEK
jgi:hypothetical protein